MRRPDFDALVADLAARGPTADELAPALAEVERQARIDRLKDSGIAEVITPADVAAVAADALDETHALRAVRRWVNARSGSATSPYAFLGLLGATGRGKTVAGAWLVARLGGAYVTAEALRRAYTGHWRDRQKFERLTSTRVVVLDDVGTEAEEESARACMFELINLRSRGWTLLTSNLSREEFDERYDDRTLGRIEGNGALVQVKGTDLRRPK